MLSICVLVSFNVATKGRVKICGQDLHLLVKQTAFNLDNDLYFYASLTLWYFSFPIYSHDTLHTVTYGQDYFSGITCLLIGYFNFIYSIHFTEFMVFLCLYIG